MSKILRGDALADCQAWLVPEVRREGERQNTPLTARQLEEIQNHAHQEGYQQGLQEGRDAGLKTFQERVGT